MCSYAWPCVLLILWFWLADLTSQLDLRPALPLWTCLAIIGLCLIQVTVSRHAIFAQVLWDCILQCWRHCSYLPRCDPLLAVGLPARSSLSLLFPDTTMPTFLQLDALILHSAVVNSNNTSLLHFYHFVIVLLSSSLYLALSPHPNAALYFIAQFEIYLWQVWRRHVSLPAVEQDSQIWFQIWGCVSRQKKCVGTQFYSFVTSWCEVFVIYVNPSVTRFLMILTEQYYDTF